MVKTHCGIIGHLVNLKDKEDHCDLCAFNNTPIDCMDKVPCRYGCYYEKIEIPQKIRRLVSLGEPRMQIIHRYGIGVFVGMRQNKEIFRSENIHEVKKVIFRDMRDKSLQQIKSTKYKKGKDGSYQISHRMEYLASGTKLREVKKRAMSIVSDYYDFLISLEDYK